MRKRMSAATKMRNRSRKSGFIGEVAAQSPELLTEPPHLEDAFSFGHLHPVFEIVPIGFGGRSESAHRDPARARSSFDGHSLVNYRPKSREASPQTRSKDP